MTVDIAKLRALLGSIVQQQAQPRPPAILRTEADRILGLGVD